MSEKLKGHLESQNLTGAISNKSLKGKVSIGGYQTYDDTELREMINAVNDKIDNYQEKDPLVREITNLELDEIFKKWEE